MAYEKRQAYVFKNGVWKKVKPVILKYTDGSDYIPDGTFIERQDKILTTSKEEYFLISTASGDTGSTEGFNWITHKPYIFERSGIWAEEGWE